MGELKQPPSPARLRKRTEAAKLYFPDLPTPSRDWMGFRPSVPDSVPVIGRALGCAEIIHAFGHWHLGVTLAAVTAELVCYLLAGHAPSRDLTATHANRFARR